MLGELKMKKGIPKLTKAMKKHRGFDAVARSIAAKQNIPLSGAKAIVASTARKASPAAVKKNPRLLRVPRGK